jgi:TonB family protein
MRAVLKSTKPLAAAASLCALLALAAWAIISPAQPPAPYDTPPALPQQDPTQSPHLEILPWKTDIQPSCDPPAVVVAVIVEKHGRPMNVHVVHGCGMGLDEKAVESVMHTQFKPALKDGVPMAVNISVKVIFDPAGK